MTTDAGIYSNNFENVGSDSNRTEMSLYIYIYVCLYK